jgi:hypothetical protein
MDTSLRDQINNSISEAEEGRELTKEWSDKIAKSNTGKVRTKEQCEANRQAQIDFWYSDEGYLVRERLSKESQAFWNSEEGTLAKQRLSKANSGLVRTEEQNKANSESKMGHEVSDETREKISIANSGLTRTEEQCDNISKGKKGIPHSEEAKATMRVFWQSNEGQKVSADRFSKRKISTFNESEQIVNSTLQTILPGEYEFTGDGVVFIGSKCPDFRHINRPKLIEFFGSYFHPAHHEEERPAYFKQFGYDTLVIWDWQLLEASESLDSFSKLVKKITEFTYS